MPIKNVKEFIEEIDINYNPSKDEYVKINNNIYSKREALEISTELISKGNEILDLIKREILRDLERIN